MEQTVSDTLMERVSRLVPGNKERPQWGSPLLSTTPISLAVPELAARVAALEEAVRELALEVQKLSAER
jgi:hypothetical protein